MNEGVKRIYADMKEQNLDSPIYTENDQSVTLILKNNIDERNLKHKSNDTTQVTQDTTQATQDATVEERILSAINANGKVSQTQMASEIGVSVYTVKYYIRKMRKEQIITREGSSQKGKWVIL